MVVLASSNLEDAARVLLGHDDHGEDHGEHHEAHEHHEAVGDERRELAHVQKLAARGDDGVGAHVDHEHHDGVDAEVHDRRVEGEDALGVREVALDLARGGVVLLLLVVLADVGLDHADAGEVLLGALVQGVVLAEDATEDRRDLAHHGEKGHGQHGDDHHEDDGKPARHRVGGDEGADEHERGADGGADEHHVGHLHVHDVSGEARHERGAGEAVDHREGEGLDACRTCPCGGSWQSRPRPSRR